MAKQKQTQQTPEQTNPKTTTEKPGSDKSNSQQIQDLKKAEFTMNYQAALGKALGPKLYELIAPHLSFEKMSSYANKAIGGIADAGVDWANSSLYDGQLSKEQEETLSTDFQDKANEFAKEFLESEEGQAVLNKIQEFIGENPYVVVGIGILAALGAVLADMDIPEIKQKFKLGDDFILKAGADIGSLRNIALKSVSLGLEYQTESIQSSLTVSHSEENGASGNHSMTIGHDQQNVKTNTNFNEKGVSDYDISGLYNFNKDSQLSGSVKGTADSKGPDIGIKGQTKIGETTHSGSVDYSNDSNTLAGNYNALNSDGHTYGLALESDLATGGLSKLTRSSGYTTSDETSSTSLQHKADLLTGESSINYRTEETLSEKLKTSFELEASNDAFSAKNSTTFGSEERYFKTDLEISDEGIKAYNLSGLYELNDNTSFSGSLGGNSDQDTPNIDLQVKTKRGDITHTGQLKYSGSENTLTGLYSGNSERLNYGLMLEGDTEGNQLSKVGGNVNYDPEGSDYYSASFQSDLLNDTHSLDLSAQTRFSDLSIRGTQGFDYNQDSGLSSSTEVLGAYHMNNDLALIGGAQYDYNSQDGGNILPKIGVQYKNIPAVITYDPKNKSVSIGLTLKF